MLVAMQHPDASSWLTLSDRRVAGLVRQHTGLRVLGAFMQGARSLSPVAKELGMTMPTALRWARRWLEVGALVVADEVPRAGRAVKWYCAAAPKLFVPHEAESGALPEGVVRRLIATRVDAQLRVLVTAPCIKPDAMAGVPFATGRVPGPPRRGTVIYLDGNGQLIVRPDFGGGRMPPLLVGHGPSALNFHTEELRLSIAHAKKLQRELVDLLKRYKAAPAGSQSYTLSVVLAPTDLKETR